jgi:hypothetical protein
LVGSLEVAVCDPLQPAVSGRELSADPIPAAAAAAGAATKELERRIGHSFADPELLADTAAAQSARAAPAGHAITNGSNFSATGFSVLSSRISCGGNTRPSRKAI